MAYLWIVKRWQIQRPAAWTHHRRDRDADLPANPPQRRGGRRAVPRAVRASM